MPVLAPHMREELAQAAFDLFAERGIGGVTLDEVAAKAGVTKGSLYWHFQSKKELILAAAALYYRNWQRQAHAEMATTSDPLEQIRRLWVMSVSTCLFDKPKRGFSTELFGLGLRDPEIRASWAQFYDTVRELFVGSIQAAVNAGKLQVDDPRRTAEWVLAAFEGIKHRASFQPQICTPSERDAIVEGLMQMLQLMSKKSAPGSALSSRRAMMLQQTSSTPDAKK
jgi:AcrR family transcriptional regulator